MLIRLLGILVFIIAIGVAYLTYDQFAEDIEWLTANPSHRISILVQNDFQNLSKTKALPMEWLEIGKLTYKMNSPVTESLMGAERPQIRVIQNNKKQGPKDLLYEAEIEVIDLPDEKNPGFILQISLLDLKTKNKVFEIGRSYYFSSLNKKKPD